jgi:hypothetical protein
VPRSANVPSLAIWVNGAFTAAPPQGSAGDCRTGASARPWN